MSGVAWKYRRTRKAKDAIFLERLCYRLVHIAELRAVAFVKNKNNMLCEVKIP